MGRHYLIEVSPAKVSDWFMKAELLDIILEARSEPMIGGNHGVRLFVLGSTEDLQRMKGGRV